jgi:hypothetical protein
MLCAADGRSAVSAALSTLEFVGYRRLGRRPGKDGSEDGQGTVEYEVLLAFGALLVIAAMLVFTRGTDHLLKRASPAKTVFTPPVAHCDASYHGVCIPPAPPDLDCADLSALGIPVPVTVVGSDPHGLDPDGDGLGC